MSRYSDDNILDSEARYLCFASSSMMKPKTIHGDKDVPPMHSMSALASALYDFDNRLPTILAGQFAKAKLIYDQSKIFPFIFIQLEDGRFISPFIVRRHELDQVDPALVLQSCYALFRFILKQAVSNYIPLIALERPWDAGEGFDLLVAMLPDSVTVHREMRDVQD